MNSIIFIALIGLVLIYWFQKSLVNSKDEKNKVKRIFNSIKLPILVICLMLIIMILGSKTNIINTTTEQKVFTSIPSF